MLTHTDESGKASMVDVGQKPAVKRTAIATAFIQLAAPTLQLIADNQLAKGDVLAVARIAGIQAAKQTATLIPLCHTLPLTHVSVDFVFEATGIRIRTSASTTAPTGVEMEALTAASIAALTIYDMAKAVDKAMGISDLRLLEKHKES
jgi:cyclic pyranopterin monophosphate synthase